MELNGIFTTLRTAYQGLSTQMRKLDAISENIANAEKMPDKNGNVYKKKAVLEEGSKRQGITRFQDQMALKLKQTNSEHIANKGMNLKIRPQSMENNSEIIEIDGEKFVFNPTHPRADETGMVKMPNVNVIEEKVDLVSATRAYEANISVMNASKQMVKKAMEI